MIGKFIESACAEIGEAQVVIWSGQHRAWWRPNRLGYTTHIEAAGRYTFADACAATRHCGPEKRIRIEPAPPPLPSVESDPASARAEIERLRVVVRAMDEALERCIGHMDWSFERHPEDHPINDCPVANLARAAREAAKEVGDE